MNPHPVPGVSSRGVPSRTSSLHHWIPAGALLLAASVAPFDLRAESMRIIPGDFELRGSASWQHLILEQFAGDLALGEIQQGIRWTTTNPGIVGITNNVAFPVADGVTVIRAESDEGSAQVTVRVLDTATPNPWSFRNHVQSVLTRTGCNMGACHGAAAGKNGFTLSLRGYDSEADYLAITRHAFGRRLVPDDPGRSLLLTKPTGAVPHKGGRRFDPGTPEYGVLADWIAAGAPGPLPSDPTLVQLELQPAKVRLSPGATQQLMVRAHFSNGRTEDVTRWAKFSAANAATAVVDEFGRVTVTGKGEGPISAWYLSRMTVASVVVPFGSEADVAGAPAPRRRNFIDDHVNRRLLELRLTANPPCSDAEFLRRGSLDTLGVLPTPEEVRSFLADSNPDKRDLWIDRWLQRPEFVDYWSYKWSDLLLVNGGRLPTRIARGYYQWIRRQVEANTPWDRFVRELVTARGSTDENGAVAFYLLHDDPRTLAENVTQAFMGMSINCAKCHNHPMEKWTNDDYYAYANLFSRIRLKNGMDQERILVNTPTGDLIQPRRGRAQTPRPLDGRPLAADDPRERRDVLADWLVSPDNPYFTRAIVNRVWANFFGAGLVERVDDFRVTNPSSNDALLDAAAAYLARQDFNLKALMRVILRSEAYQRSSTPAPGNAADTRFYSRYLPRRLMAEVALDAISQATGTPTDFTADARQGQRPDQSFPAGFRALQLPDSFVRNEFLKSFGRPDRLQTCECERSSEPSVAQVLHLSNGDTLNQKLSAPTNRITALLQQPWDPSRLLDEAFLATLGRPPRPAERDPFLGKLNNLPSSEHRAAAEDLFWALLTSKEFLFNH